MTEPKIGDGCIIAEGVSIGDNVIIENYCVIYEDVSIGDGTHIRSFVEIRPGTIIGKTNEGRLATDEIASINEQAIRDVINPKGFQSIGIAGMNYASHVESKGYNVISYQADVCLVDLATYLEKLEVIEKGTGARMEESFIPEDLPQNFTVNG